MKYIFLLFFFCFFELQVKSQSYVYNDSLEFKLHGKLLWQYDTKDYEGCCTTMDSLIEDWDLNHTSALMTGVRCYLKCGRAEDADKVALFGNTKGLVSKKSTSEVEMPMWRDSFAIILIEDQGLPNVRQEIYEAELTYLIQKARLDLPYMEVRANHIQTLNNFIGKYGFPTRSQIGEIGMKSIKLILLHSPENIIEQYKDQIAKNWNPSAYAIAIDKIQVSRGEKQIYGSQGYYDEDNGVNKLYPVEDYNKVDHLRMNMGLIPLEYYLRMANIQID